MANYEQMEEKMQKTLSVLERDLAGVRAGRANPAILDRITVPYYGVETPLQQVAAVSVPEPRMLMIQPWDATLVKEIEKAILASDNGITPTSDGKVLRLGFPQPTEERRRELVKDVKKYGEESKVAIRSVRRDTIEKYKKMEKAHEITEDDLRIAEDEIQKLTDQYCQKVDKIISEKESEVMSV